PPRSTLFPYTTLFRSRLPRHVLQLLNRDARLAPRQVGAHPFENLVEHTHRGSAVSSNRKCCATDASRRQNALPAAPRKFAFAMHWSYVHVARPARRAPASALLSRPPDSPRSDRPPRSATATSWPRPPGARPAPWPV